MHAVRWPMFCLGNPWVSQVVSVSELWDAMVPQKERNKMTGSPARAQEEAIRREWREARQEGKLELANRIERANPDLFPATNGRREEESHGNIL